jgi:hypothetical protein
MPDRFLPDDGLSLLSGGVRPETRRVFFEWPVDRLTRPRLRTVSLILGTEELTLADARRIAGAAPPIIDRHNGVPAGSPGDSGARALSPARGY